MSDEKKPLPLEFIINAIEALEVLNEHLKQARGENEHTRRIDANIKKMREAVKSRTN